LSAERARTGSHVDLHNARMEAFKQSMSRLAGRWTRRFEIEARECEHSEGRSRREQQAGFDQQGRLRKAILGLKAQIGLINQKLNNLSSSYSSSRFGKPLRISQRTIANLIQRRQEHEAALAELEREQRGLQQFAANSQNGASEQVASGGAPEVTLQKVAPGVAELSLVDLNAPISSTLEQAKRHLAALGAPIRKLTDPRILEAAEYKVRNAKSTYAEVSIKFFQTPGRADSIRYWVNKRKSRVSNK